ncbi:hypothetical protein TNCV_4172491 [Trichonephila clavipes]|nr:hypothetical protein TNCV_4172491 [Trichonephila clavipes]
MVLIVKIAVNNPALLKLSIHAPEFSAIILFAPSFPHPKNNNVLKWVAWWLEHLTPDRKPRVRCPMPPNALREHMEYVLFKYVGPNVLWADHECRSMPTTGVLLAPWQDDIRGPSSDYVRHVSLATTTTMNSIIMFFDVNLQYDFNYKQYKLSR